MDILCEATATNFKCTDSVIIDSEECNWIMLGVTGAGKSCLGNFLLGKEEAFKESEIVLESETKTATKDAILFGDAQQHKICIIDTPGLGDTENLGKHNFKAIDIAEDASSLIIELTKIMLIMRAGISAFFIVIPATGREHSGTLNLLDFLDILGNYWDHSIVVVTRAKELGRTEKDQYDTFRRVLKGPSCPPVWDTLSKKVNERFVLVESKEYRGDRAYRNRVMTKLTSLTNEIITENGPYHDALDSIGNQAFQNARMELCNEFENLESHEAKEAIYENVCERVKKVVFKLVRIKMAGGKDVDQLEEMAKVKAEENAQLLEEADRLQRKYEEEQRKRREAAERLEREKEKRIRADEAKRIAEERKEKELKRRIEVERENNHTQELLDTVQKQRDAAESQTEKERGKREAAENEKYTAQRKLDMERCKREEVEREKNAAKRKSDMESFKREEAEREKNTAKQNLDMERCKREKAEREKNAAKHETEQERNRRRMAEQDKNTVQMKMEEEKRSKEAAIRAKNTALLETEKERLKRQTAEQAKKTAQQVTEQEICRREIAEQRAEQERRRTEVAYEREERERKKREEAEEDKKNLLRRNLVQRVFNVDTSKHDQ